MIHIFRKEKFDEHIKTRITLMIVKNILVNFCEEHLIYRTRKIQKILLHFHIICLLMTIKRTFKQKRRV